MKTKSLLTFILFILVLFPHQANGTRKTDFVTLRERTFEGYLLTIYRGSSIDYRSYLLIEFADSLINERIRIKIEVELIRKNGARFEIPVPIYSQLTDSGTIAYICRDYDPEGDLPLKDTYVRLRRWAAEPGDEIHLKIYDDIGYSYELERYIPVKRHDLWGNVSFPVLCVQRSGDHPGTLGAGISYTLRYVQPERSLLNKLGFGVNLSFLDFDPDQKIEIGLGLVLSFPDDIFHLGVGKNLTVNHDSGYYFLGINLYGIKEKFGL